MQSTLDQHLSIYERHLEELESKLADQNAQLEDVAKMGLMITSLLDLESVLAAMMEIAVRTLDGEVGCIILQEDDRQTARISWGVDRELLRSIKVEGDTDIVDWIMKTGQAIVLGKTTIRGPEKVRINTLIAAPLISRETPFGVLIVINRASGQPFTDDDKLRIQLLVRFASVAIENANLLKSKLLAQKLEQELELARTVQNTLLPSASEQFGNAEIEAVYAPAGHLSGDYYDIIKLADDEFVVIVGDVSSKGVPAALMMAAIRSVFRIEATRKDDLAVMVSRLNTFLCEQVLHSKNMFVSLAYCHFNLRDMLCTYVNAGHLPPVHFRSSTNDVVEWRTGGTVIGQFSDFQYKSESVKINEGDKILFYTDGVSESENSSAELFGRPRVREFLQQNSALGVAALNQKLLDAVKLHRLGTDPAQFDDTTVLTVGIL